MPHVRFIQVGGRLSPAGWLLVFLTLALIAGIAIAVAILALSVFLIVAPVVVLAGFAYYLYRKIWPRAHAHGDGVIEGEYRVIESERIERKSGREPPQR